MRRVCGALIVYLAVIAGLTGWLVPVACAGTERAICVTTGNQETPDVFGDRIVWADNRNSNWDIYMKDLFTGLEVPICMAAGDQTAPAIFGDRIVWQDDRNGNDDIYMYDLATATEWSICIEAHTQAAPAIFGNTVVWADNRNGSDDIYMFDVGPLPPAPAPRSSSHLGSIPAYGTEFPVCTHAASQQSPAIWDNFIVWMDNRNGNWDIYQADWSAGVPVCAAAGDQMFPEVSANRIVWQDYRNGNWDIYMYDVATVSESPICTEAANQQYPAIWGDRIVWEDDRFLGTTGTDIGMHDLATQDESPICVAAGNQGVPRICDDHIVWQDYRSGTSQDIYMYDLDPSWGERQITSLPSGQSSPDISGRRIAWQDNRNGNEDIYMYDLATATENPICSQAAWQTYPAIWGDRIVWYDQRNGGLDIYMYDVATATESPISTYPAPKYTPDIWGHRIVWRDVRNLKNDIYMFDMMGGTESLIPTVGMCMWPTIWGGRIVWRDGRNDAGDIYMYDLATIDETGVCADAGQQNLPEMFGDRVVWQDLRNGNDDIYMYDVVNSYTATPICTQAASQQFPVIWSDRVVWQDNRDGNWDIYMYNLGTGAESVLCKAAGNQTAPAIDGDRIVWQDDRNGNADIYMQKLAMCSFDDVVRTHVFWPQIEAIYAHDVAQGTSTAPPMYSPTSACTRGQMATFLCKAYGKTWYDPGHAHFSDVARGSDGLYTTPPYVGGYDADGTHIFFGWIERCADAASWGGTAVAGGFGDGTYRPNQACTRGQMAKFLCSAAGKTWYAAPTQKFSDVGRGSDGLYSTPPYANGYDADGTHIFYGWIERLADTASWGVYGAPTGGFGDSTFRPSNNCARGEMAKFIQRAREYELPVK